MKKIILTLMMSATVMASYAQADHEDVMNYRRSSLYSLMVNHTDQQFANEIRRLSYRFLFRISLIIMTLV